MRSLGVFGYNTYSLAYDTAANVLYAGCYAPTALGTGVWKYDGIIWVNTAEGISNFSIPCLAYDSDNNTLYAGTHNNGVWSR